MAWNKIKYYIICSVFNRAQCTNFYLDDRNSVRRTYAYICMFCVFIIQWWWWWWWKNAQIMYVDPGVGIPISTYIIYTIPPATLIFSVHTTSPPTVFPDLTDHKRAHSDDARIYTLNIYIYYIYI